MHIKVLGICGSPRNGNSAFLLREALSSAQECGGDEVTTEFYSLRGKKIAPCLSCFRCRDTAGQCAQKDDFHEARKKWLESDVIIYSVPVYHMGIPGQLKCFIDRLGCTIAMEFRPVLGVRPRLSKIIGAIAQGSDIFAGQEHAITELIYSALFLKCIVVTGDLEQSYVGIAGSTHKNTETRAIEKSYHRGQLAAVSLVEASRNIGRRAVEMAKIVIGGGLENAEYLRRDPAYLPFVKHITEKI